MKKRIASKELSGVLILIFTVLFLQTIIFLFRPSEGDKESVDSESTLESGTVYNSENPLKAQPQKRSANNRSGFDRSGQQISNQFKAKQSKSSQSKLSGDRITNSRSSAKEQVSELYPFDPNTASKDELIRLGMTEKQASVVLNYRDRGGKFRDKEDFRKIYSVSDQFFTKVEEYIVIHLPENHYESPDNRLTHTLNNSASDETHQNIEKQHREVDFLLELNGADSADLVKLKGIGPYYASKILRYRDRLGGFIHPGQLTEISGIDSARYLMFAGNIIVDSSKVEKRDLATATYSQLASNPYIGSYIARAIIRYAERNEGQKISITDLLAKNIIKRELYNILCIYFR
ncbi:MAG: helix-hairpin-helix domain-containing protein [Bacteroidales bacterium]|nr:helix-hairpin-helix domain-containing protein [Bacteroidales bacterium]